VHMFVFGSEWLLLLWIVQGCDNVQYAWNCTWDHRV